MNFNLSYLQGNQTFLLKKLKTILNHGGQSTSEVAGSLMAIETLQQSGWTLFPCQSLSQYSSRDTDCVDVVDTSDLCYLQLYST